MTEITKLEKENKENSVCMDIFVTNKERYLQYLSGARRTLHSRNPYLFNPPMAKVGDEINIHRNCRIKYVPRSYRFKITSIDIIWRKDPYSGRKIMKGYTATITPIDGYYLVYEIYYANDVHYFLKGKPYYEINVK